MAPLLSRRGGQTAWLARNARRSGWGILVWHEVRRTLPILPSSGGQTHERPPTRPGQYPEVAATPAQIAAVAKAKALADIAAQSAKLAGVDVTITPCPEVVIQVGSPPQPTRCWGVQFDQEYLLVLLPSSNWRALKIDPVTRSVVLRLAGWGGFRPYVVRILTCLIYDRLKAQRDRFEPQIAVLRQPEAPLQLTSVPDPPVYPDPDRFTRASAQAVPKSVSSDSLANQDPVTAPESPAPSGSAPSPEPAAPAVPAPPPKPAKPARPQATTGGKTSPLAKRVRH